LPNPDKIRMWISALIAILATGLIFLPSWIGMDGMKGGYALSFVAFFFTISAAIVTWFFWGRASRLERISRGQDVLVHWTYSPAEWKQYIAAELNAQTQKNRTLWWVISGFCLAIGGLFWLFDHEAGRLVFLILLGMALLLALFAFGLPWLTYRRQQRHPGEAWITPVAVFFDNNLTYWNYGGSRLDRVTWQEVDGNLPPCLRFEISFWDRIGPQSQVLRVPVPFGQETEARTLLARFDKC
jgi:hypothetical protein